MINVQNLIFIVIIALISLLGHISEAKIWKSPYSSSAIKMKEKKVPKIKSLKPNVPDTKSLLKQLEEEEERQRQSDEEWKELLAEDYDPDSKEIEEIKEDGWDKLGHFLKFISGGK